MNRFRKATAEQFSAAIRPSFQEESGKWLEPLLSKRKAAAFRKEALENGKMGTWTPGQGGWLHEWDQSKQFTIMKAPKLHKRQRDIEKRVQKVQDAMATMPQKLEEYRRQAKANRPLKGLDKWLSSKDTH